MIPKIIHYCWFTKDKIRRLPDKVRQSLLSWKKHCPGWRIMLWNFSNFRSDLNKFTISTSQHGLIGYSWLSDYAKLKALYDFGGICLDPDQELTIGLDELLSKSLFFDKTLGNINFIGSEKGNETIKKLMGEYENRNFIDKFGKISAYPSPSVVLNSYNSSHVDSKKFIIDHGLDSINKSVKISIVMPVKNGEKYISECIDSVLSQTFTDFEFIIVNDGSTDKTEAIVKSYTDDRIVFINEFKSSRGISEALNIGIARSSGKYIARMDADDKMYPDRLKVQFDWLENHPDVDILGSGFEWGNGKEVPEYYVPRENITDDILIKTGNFLCHPTVMMRKSSIDKLPFLYESYYNGAEDLKLWITAIRKGLKISNIKQPLLYYRQHPDQITVKNESDGFSSAAERIKLTYTRRNKDINELTCIIPFKNEGSEIERTVTSIRATSKTNIILIDDGSTDGYDYEKIAIDFGCDFYKNDVSLGVAGSRNFGVEKCKTEYFVLLDGHMRFYNDNWEKRVLSHLKNHPKSIITSNSSIFTRDNDVSFYSNEDGKGTDKSGNNGCKAAVINLYESGWEFTSKWTSKTYEELEDKLAICSSVMGAFYSSSKTWWKHIGGLDGLLCWGYDEPLMSLKTYLAGGNCYILKDFYVGHFYRGVAPYSSSSPKLDSNHLYLINLFAPENKISEYEENFKNRIGIDRFNRAKEEFKKREEETKKYREYFWSNVATRTFEEFLEFNNKYY